MNVDDDIYDLGAARVSAYRDIKTPDREIPRPTKSSNDSRRLHGSSIEKHNSQQLALAGRCRRGQTFGPELKNMAAETVETIPTY